MVANLGPEFAKLAQALQHPEEEMLKQQRESNQKFASVNDFIGDQAVKCFDLIKKGYESTSDIAKKKEWFATATQIIAGIKNHVSKLSESDLKKWEAQKERVQDFYESMKKELESDDSVKRYEFDVKERRQITRTMRKDNSEFVEKMRKDFKEAEEIHLDPHALQDFESRRQARTIYHVICNFCYTFPRLNLKLETFAGELYEEAPMQLEWLYSEFNTFVSENPKYKAVFEPLLPVLNMAIDISLQQTGDDQIKLIEYLKEAIRTLSYPDNATLLIPGYTKEHALCYQISKEPDGSFSLWIISTQDRKISNHVGEIKLTGLKLKDFSSKMLWLMAIPDVNYSPDLTPPQEIYKELSVQSHVKQSPLEKTFQNEDACMYARMYAFLKYNVPKEAYTDFMTFLQSRVLKRAEEIAPQITEEHCLMLFGDAKTNPLPELFKSAHKYKPELLDQFEELLNKDHSVSAD